MKRYTLRKTNSIKDRISNWYQAPITFSFKKSTLIIFALIAYIVWSHIHHTKPNPTYNTFNFKAYGIPSKGIKPIDIIENKVQPFDLVQTIGPTVMSSPLVDGYDPGNCTWFVASKDAIPNSWGDARNWLYSAQIQGYSTGSTPKVGSVAWFSPGSSLGHVALVTGINADGSAVITEMNVKGLGIIDERTISASGATYIY